MISNDPTLAGRYLADQLTAEERQEYESALQRDPDLLAELEATARLKVGLARLRETGQLERLPKASARWTLSRVLPLAAGIGAVAIGIAVWHSPAPPAASSNWMARSPALLSSSAGRPLNLSTVVAVFRKRSDSLDAQAALPEGAGAVELRVLPTTPIPAARFRLQLAQIRDNNMQPVVGSVEGLAPAADGFVTAYADASHLSSGRYTLTLTAVSSSGNELMQEKFAIELTREAKN